MEFRTEIEPVKGTFEIDHSTPVVMLGSCFTDAVGERMERDGFDVVHNPMGPLYNPLSMAKVLVRGGRPYTMADLRREPDGWHCLDFAWRYHHADADRLLETVNADYAALARAVERAEVVIATFGTAWVFEENRTGAVVGNCHKIAAREFTRRQASLAEMCAAWASLRHKLPRCIFTVSPIRHTADGLAGNSLSKASLRLLADTICASAPQTDYFPSYEIMLDDLRDYRFYAADMKHPSEVAADYIYQHFAKAYFSAHTCTVAAAHRRDAARRAHRPLM